MGADADAVLWEHESAKGSRVTLRCLDEWCVELLFGHIWASSKERKNAHCHLCRLSTKQFGGGPPDGATDSQADDECDEDEGQAYPTLRHVVPEPSKQCG